MFYLCRMIKNGTPDYLCMKFCGRVSLPVYLFKIQLWNTCCEIAGDTLNPVEKFKSQGLKNPTELKIGDLHKGGFCLPLHGHFCHARLKGLGICFDSDSLYLCLCTVGLKYFSDSGEESPKMD